MNKHERRARTRIAVLASGGGSNLGALLDHLDKRGERRGGDVVLVASGRADAGALERARRRGIATEVTTPSEVGAALSSYEVDLVVLAGYLSLVPDSVTERFPGRMLNVHPALLPAFGGKGLYGARVHRAVIDAGARVSGATVHFVDAHYDRGPIAAQWPVPVLPSDTPESLATRVLRVEHLLLPRVVDGVARGRIRLGSNGRVEGGFALAHDAAFMLDAFDDGQLGAQIDALIGQ